MSALTASRSCNCKSTAAQTACWAGSEGIELILQWMDEVETITAQSWSLLAQAYFQVGSFNKSRSAMETAISMAEEEGYKPKEQWYVVVAACIEGLTHKLQR